MLQSRPKRNCHSSFLHLKYDITTLQLKSQKSDILSSQDIQKKAQQSLLDLQSDLTFQTKNPEADFMLLTKNVNLDDFHQDKSNNKFMTLNSDFDKFIVTRNNFKKTKSHLCCNFNEEKPIRIKRKCKDKKKQSSEDEKTQLRQMSQKNELQAFFARTKSNLLSPRQNFPTIYPSDQHYSALTRRTRLGLKPYSLQKNSLSTLKLSPINKLRQQLSLFPSIEKQIKRRKIFGYS